MFDAFMRTLSRVMPRRAALAALAGVVTARLTADEAEAQNGAAVGGGGRRGNSHAGRKKDRRRRRRRRSKRSRACLSSNQDLQAAIDAAKHGATIHLCGGTWALPSTIVMVKNLTLHGAGDERSILDGRDTVRVLAIAAGVNVTLRDLRVTKGKTPNGDLPVNAGGGIFNAGALTLHGSSVTESSGVFGGGIYNSSGSTLTLLDSSVSGNKASMQGGGIVNYSATLTLIESSVTGNTAQDDGGGINNNSGGMLTLKAGSSLAGNSSRHGGGVSNGGSMTLEANSSVANNSAQETGGGIWNVNTLTLQAGSSVTGNTADKGAGIFTGGGAVTLKGQAGRVPASRVIGNSATSAGGGIYDAGGTVTIDTADIVVGNTANGGPEPGDGDNCYLEGTIANCIG